MPANVVQHPIYGKSAFDTSEKFRSLLFQIFHTHQFDIVHYFFTPTPLNATLNKIILTSSHAKTVQTAATLRQDLFSDQQLHSIFFADRVITYTEASRQKLSDLGVHDVVQVPPGLVLDDFSPAPKDPELLKRLGLTEENLIVSYAGEYARLGATDMIADMLVRYFSKFPESPMRFLFACRIKNDADKRKEDELKHFFQENAILDKIAFSGTVSDVHALYNVADIITFPVANLHGKFDVPLVIPEAYACEKPVILSDLPQFSEFTNPDISVTIPVDDAQALADAIEALRIDPERRALLGKNARAYVLEHFSIERVAKEYNQLYQSLI